MTNGRPEDGLAKVSLGARKTASNHSMKLNQYQSATPFPPPLRGRVRVGGLASRPGLNSLPWLTLSNVLLRDKKDRKS